MDYTSVREVKSRLSSRLHIDMDLFDVVDACSDLLMIMGIRPSLKSMVVDKIKNFCIALPKGTQKIDSVVRLDEKENVEFSLILQDIYFPEQKLFVATTSSSTYVASEFKDEYIDRLKGPYMDFVWDCPLVKFNETDVTVAITVKSIPLDKEGFPKIPDPLLLACVYYCAKVYHEPLFMLGQVHPVIMKSVNEMSDNHIGMARSMLFSNKLNDNEADKILALMVSMDRKTFNVAS